MATNYVAEGNVITYSNAGAAISSGAVVEVNGPTLGVAIDDIAATSGVGPVAIEGVFDLPKVSAAVIAIGELVIWDTSAGAFDDENATPGTGDITNAAIAMEAGVNTQTLIKVKLLPGNGTVN